MLIMKVTHCNMTKVRTSGVLCNVIKIYTEQ